MPFARRRLRGRLGTVGTRARLACGGTGDHDRLWPHQQMQESGAWLQIAALTRWSQRTRGKRVSVPEAVVRTGIPSKTLHRWVQQGKIPSKKDALGRILVLV